MNGYGLRRADNALAGVSRHMSPSRSQCGGVGGEKQVRVRAGGRSPADP